MVVMAVARVVHAFPKRPCRRRCWKLRMPVRMTALSRDGARHRHTCVPAPRHTGTDAAGQTQQRTHLPPARPPLCLQSTPTRVCNTARHWQRGWASARSKSRCAELPGMEPATACVPTCRVAAERLMVPRQPRAWGDMHAAAGCCRPFPHPLHCSHPPPPTHTHTPHPCCVSLRSRGFKAGGVGISSSSKGEHHNPLRLLRPVGCSCLRQLLWHRR